MEAAMRLGSKVVLASALAVFAVTGCDEKKPEPKPATTTAPAAAAPAKASAAPAKAPAAGGW
jgi:hypothetical protein